MRPSRPRVRAALSSLSLALTLALGACNSHEQVFSGITCPDPCCGGPSGIDCAKNPNVACSQPADPCGTIAYGCVGGSVYVDASIPLSCNGDATPIFTEPDAAEASDDALGADASAATDAPAGDAGANDAAPADATLSDASSD
jgi:hypothetical protein